MDAAFLSVMFVQLSLVSVQTSFPADFLPFGYTAMLRRKVLLYLTTGRPRLKIISQSLAIDTVQMIYNI